MNPQGNKDNPKGGIEWTHIFGPRSGFTANPVRGCKHACRWRMPNGKLAICYAEAFANKQKPDSFSKITFHPEVLEGVKNHHQPAGIFIDSMSDLFGNEVAPAHIQKVIMTMLACPQHIFFTLTKNPRKLLIWDFPDNCLVGMSSPPTFMYDSEMSPETQRVWFEKGLTSLLETKAKRVWLSLEPLSVDVADIIRKHSARISWAVIGAASDGREKFQPDEKLFRKTLKALEGVPVFFKGNIDKDLAARNGGWREEFPRMRKVDQIRQANLI